MHDLLLAVFYLLCLDYVNHQNLNALNVLSAYQIFFKVLYQNDSIGTTATSLTQK